MSLVLVPRSAEEAEFYEIRITTENTQNNNLNINNTITDQVNQSNSDLLTKIISMTKKILNIKFFLFCIYVSSAIVISHFFPLIYPEIKIKFKINL